MSWTQIINQAMKSGKPVRMQDLRNAAAGPNGLAEALETAERFGIQVIGKQCYGERLASERLPERRYHGNAD
jgi:hypothetical protein